MSGVLSSPVAAAPPGNRPRDWKDRPQQRDSGSRLVGTGSERARRPAAVACAGSMACTALPQSAFRHNFHIFLTMHSCKEHLENIYTRDPLCHGRALTRRSRTQPMADTALCQRSLTLDHRVTPGDDRRDGPAPLIPDIWHLASDSPVPWARFAGFGATPWAVPGSWACFAGFRGAACGVPRFMGLIARKRRRPKCRIEICHLTPLCMGSLPPKKEHDRSAAPESDP